MHDKFKYHEEYRSDATHLWLDCTEKNPRGETILVEVKRNELRYENSYDLGRIWKQRGYIDGTLKSRWLVDTYVYDTKGNCFRSYDPTMLVLRGKPERDGHVSVRHVIDFDWMLEDTDENLERILGEIYRRFMAMEPTHAAPSDYVRN